MPCVKRFSSVSIHNIRGWQAYDNTLSESEFVDNSLNFTPIVFKLRIYTDEYVVYEPCKGFSRAFIIHVFKIAEVETLRTVTKCQYDSNIDG